MSTSKKVYRGADYPIVQFSFAGNISLDIQKYIQKIRQQNIRTAGLTGVYVPSKFADSFEQLLVKAGYQITRTEPRQLCNLTPNIDLRTPCDKEITNGICEPRNISTLITIPDSDKPQFLQMVINAFPSSRILILCKNRDELYSLVDIFRNFNLPKNLWRWVDRRYPTEFSTEPKIVISSVFSLGHVLVRPQETDLLVLNKATLIFQEKLVNFCTSASMRYRLLGLMSPGERLSKEEKQRLQNYFWRYYSYEYQPYGPKQISVKSIKIRERFNLTRGNQLQQRIRLIHENLARTQEVAYIINQLVNDCPENNLFRTIRYQVRNNTNFELPDSPGIIVLGDSQAHVKTIYSNLIQLLVNPSYKVHQTHNIAQTDEFLSNKNNIRKFILVVQRNAINLQLLTQTDILVRAESRRGIPDCLPVSIPATCENRHLLVVDVKDQTSGWPKNNWKSRKESYLNRDWQLIYF